MDENSQTQEQPNLALSDLVILLNLVRVTSDRGAIKADELSTVGAVYDRLVKFLENSGAINNTAPAEPAPEQPA
jgi:hypothetical protein